MSVDELFQNKSIPAEWQPNTNSFVAAFNRVQRLAHENSDRHGFHDLEKKVDENALKLASLGLDPSEIRDALLGQRLSLITSEISEALEAARAGDPPDNHIPAFGGEEAELADTVIRIMDLAEAKKLRLAEAIIAKLVYNRTRPVKHGGKRF